MTSASFAAAVAPRCATAALAVALVLVGVPPARAQTMTIDCFAPVDCQRAIGGTLTPKLIAKYPPRGFKLVVFGSVHRYTDTTGAAYAVAGVSDRIVHNGVDLTVMPLKRYSASAPIDTGGAVTESLEREALTRAVRAAVERMVDVCEKTPECAVHKPYR